MKIIIPLIVFILILLILGFYFYNFNGNFSKNQSDWGDFGDYVGGVLSTLLGFTSFIIALFALYRTIEKEKFALFFKFLENYRSKQMSEDIILLWNFYTNIEKFVKEKYSIDSDYEFKKETLIYFYLKNNYKSEHLKRNKIYSARRNISHFYLQLSICLQNNEISKKKLFAIWSYDVLGIINKIIIPCETAIGESFQLSTKLYPFKFLLTEALKFKTRRFQKQQPSSSHN